MFSLKRIFLKAPELLGQQGNVRLYKPDEAPRPCLVLLIPGHLYKAGVDDQDGFAM